MGIGITHTAFRRPAPFWLLVTLFCAVSAIAAIDPGFTGERKFPDVIAVKIAPRGADQFDFRVTVSSPYDSPARYADAFRILGEGGAVYGERQLLHDHAGEQPLTRTLYGVTVPADVKTVVIQARDQKSGYGAKTMVMALPGRQSQRIAGR